MSEGTLNLDGYSTFEVRVRAIKAVVERGLSVTEVAQAHCIDRRTVHRWLTRYYCEGDNGLVRRKVSGRPRCMAEICADDLKTIVMSRASDFGFETDFWTTRRLIQVTQSEFGISVSKQTMMRRLHEAGLSYQKPSREYFELSEEDRQEWRKNEVPKIQCAVRDFRAILYFQDEANISLTALLAKTWAPRGKTPKQRVTGKRGGVSAMSAINGSGQLIFRLYEKRIASEQVMEFLEGMLKHHPRRHLVVVMDQAPPHTSKRTRAYIASKTRLHVFHLPKYSPDWNPDEKVWNHLKHQELAGHQAKTQAEIKEIANQKLEAMSTNRSLLQGIFFRCCMSEAMIKQV